MDNMINNMALLVSAIGALACVISVITQVTKELPLLAKIPTALQVTVMSIVLTPIAYAAYAQYTYMQMHWYMIVASIIAGFFVAFIAMFGWDKLTEIYTKFKK